MFLSNRAVRIVPCPFAPEGANGWVYASTEEGPPDHRVRRYTVVLDDGNGMNMDRAREAMSGLEERYLVGREVEAANG